MRPLEDVIHDFEVVCEDTTMCEEDGNTGVYVYKNRKRRQELEKEYESFLPENERMAILLHDNLCHSDHTSVCGWYYEKNGVVHDWTRNEHKRYLEKADKLIASGIDIYTMEIIFERLK